MLIALAILVRVTLSDGSVIQCQTEEAVVYSPQDRVIEVRCCGIFSDGFEE